jgi:hypothetical protein
MRCLLDKNVIRYALSGLHHGHRRLLSPLEAGALLFWQAAETQEVELFISQASYQVLQQLSRYHEVSVLLNSMEVLYPTRYHARWARRLRDTTGLSREDAAIIALATFGTNLTGTILSVHQVVTYDQAMITGYTNHLPTLQRRLKAMTSQLPAPFHRATLPDLTTPDTIQFE